MPMVEGKKFPYTKAGISAAKKASKKREIEYGKPKKGKGGRVEVGGPGWREINKKKKK